jgi:hypothetical protein
VSRDEVAIAAVALQANRSASRSIASRAPSDLTSSMPSTLRARFTNSAVTVAYRQQRRGSPFDCSRQRSRSSRPDRLGQAMKARHV